MSEDTVRDGARTVKKKKTSLDTLRGLPRGLYVSVADVLSYMQWSRETWQAWRDAGLRTQYPNTKAEHVYTDWVIDFLIDHPEFDRKTAGRKE